MCGITGIYVKDPESLSKKADKEKLSRMLDELLLGIENRGRDATGFIASGDSILIDKAPIEAKAFIKIRKHLPENVRFVLGHTRLATKGDPSEWANNHPVIHEGTFVTHNGVISNDDTLFEEEQLKRYAKVDTEIIAAMLTKYGTEDPGEGLSKLKGSFACAAFTATKPEELLLFRGHGSHGSPLVFHENKQFIVWASTQDAIKEAWAKALGTPPSWAKFERVDEGTILRINGDTVEVMKDTIKKPAFQSSGWSSQGWNTDWEDGDWGSCEAPIHIERRSDSSSTNVIAGELDILSPKPKSIRTIVERRKNKDKIEECAKHVNGTDWTERNAILWDKRTDYAGAMREKMGKKPRWYLCSVCKTTVCLNTLKEHSVFGKACIDCWNFLTAVNLNDTLDIKGNPYTELETLDGIEDYVQIDAYVHYNTLRKLEDYTGMTLHSIDYLLHRATPEYLAKSEIKAIYEDLKEKYDTENGLQWEAYSENYEKEHWSMHGPVTAEPVTLSEIVIENEWVSCASGTHKKSDKCDACDDVKDEVRILTGEVIVEHEDIKVDTPDLSKTFAYYREPKKDHVRLWRPGDPIKGKEKRDGKCLLCPKNSKVLINQDFRWCNNHFNFCGIKSEDKKCSNEPVGWDEFGIRRCHFHSRGVKNFMTQKTLASIRERATSNV